MTEIIIGADISKDHIDLHRLPDGKRLHVSNDRKGFAAIVKWIDSATLDRLVYEPTGPYHKAFECFMMTKGLRLSKVNPRFARRFCEAAKTDRIDAELLARYGQLLQPRILQTQTHILSELKELHAARQALVKDRTAAKNRSKNLVNPLLKKQNAARLRQIESQLKAVTESIMTLVSNDQTLKARYDILVSIPGLSQITAFALLIEIPELGELDEKAAEP